MRRSVWIEAAGVASTRGIGLRELATELCQSPASPARFERLCGAPIHRVPVASAGAAPRPQALLAIALEQVLAALPGSVRPDRIGVVASSSKGDWFDPQPEILDNLADAPAQFVRRRSRAQGPCAGTAAACATGLTNVALGADWIARGDADAVLCAVTESTLRPLYVASFAQLGVLTAERCRPWDSRRDGFVLAEGAAAFLLLEESLAREPLARIAAVATGADAVSQTGLDVEGASLERVLRIVLRDAGWQAASLALVQPHGTATLANDRAEAAALRRLGIGDAPVLSLKGAMGHAMGAAAGVELAACLGMMRLGCSAGNAGTESVAEDCRGLHFPTGPLAGDLRRVLKSAQGFGGSIAAVLLERP